MTLLRKLLLIVLFAGCLTMLFPLSRGEVQNSLGEILRQDKYQYEEYSSPEVSQDPTLLERILKSLSKFFTYVLSVLGPIGGVFAGIVILAVVAVLIVWMIRRYRIRVTRPYHTDPGIERDQRGHLNYKKEFQKAMNLFADGKLKQTISTLLNCLWLFYHYSKIVTYKKSRTNREYLGMITDNTNYSQVRSLVMHAEQSVYFQDIINKEECEEIINTVTEFIS